MNRGTLILSTAIVLTVLGILLNFVDVSDAAYYRLLVPSSAVSLTAGFLCALWSWKLHATKSWKVSAALIMLICAIALPDLILRRLPFALTNSTPPGKQRLLMSAIQARLRKDYPGAERLYKEIIRGENVDGVETNPTDSPQLDLADVLEREGKFAEAEQQYRQAVQKAVAVWGPTDEHMVPLLEGLARTLKAQNKLSESLESYKSALAINEENWKKDKQSSQYYEAVSKRISVACAELESTH